MKMYFLLLLVQLHITAGCRLEGNRNTVITAYTGESVLLPCSCTDIHTKPHTHTWSKFSNEWVKISPDSDQYKDRLQLVNDHHPGNLSLIISHLTVHDGGVYRCVTEKEERFFRLTVEGCTIHNEIVDVAGYEGQSVLLPCSCTHLQAKPQTFTWLFYTGRVYKVIFPKDQINHYTHRVQIYNNHHPGNLSLLISHLTLQDGGYYRCQTVNNNYKDIKLTVKEAPKTPSPSTTTIQTTSNAETKPSVVSKHYTNPHTVPSETASPPYFPVAVVTVIFLHMIVVVVYCSTRKKDTNPVHYSRGDGDGTVSLQ